MLMNSEHEKTFKLQSKKLQNIKRANKVIFYGHLGCKIKTYAV